jgi:hypothetical protein
LIRGDSLYLLTQKLALSEIFSFFEPPPKVTRLPDVLGILRLSDKYDVVYLRHRALEHLETVYVSSLDAYDAGSIMSTFGVTEKGHVFVARVAMQVNAPWIVPCAVYKACSAGLTSICDMDSEETTIDSLQKKCLNTLTQHLHAFFDRPPFYVILPSLASSCAQEGKCAQMANTIVHDWNKGLLGTTILDPLQAWKDEIDGIARFELCPACSVAALAAITDCRQRWWANMPSKFGLLDWPDLLLLRAAAFDLS